jgi:hypothetical protein
MSQPAVKSDSNLSQDQSQAPPAVILNSQNVYSKGLPKFSPFLGYFLPTVLDCFSDSAGDSKLLIFPTH